MRSIPSKFVLYLGLLLLSACNYPLEGRPIGCRTPKLIWNRMSVENGKLFLWRNEVSPFSEYKPTEFDNVKVKLKKRANSEHGSQYEIVSEKTAHGLQSTFKIYVTMNQSEDAPALVETTVDQKELNGHSSSHLDETCEAKDIVLELPLPTRDRDALVELGRGSEIYYYGSGFHADPFGDQMMQNGEIGPIDINKPYCTVSANILSNDAHNAEKDTIRFEDSFQVSSVVVDDYVFDGVSQTSVGLEASGLNDLSPASRLSLKCYFLKSMPEVNAADINAIIGPSFRIGLPSTAITPEVHDSSFVNFMNQALAQSTAQSPAVPSQSNLTIASILSIKKGEMLYYRNGNAFDPATDPTAILNDAYCAISGSDKTDVTYSAGTQFSLSSANREFQNGDPMMPASVSLKDPYAKGIEYILGANVTGAASSPGDAAGLSILCNSFDLHHEFSIEEIQNTFGGLVQFK